MSISMPSWLSNQPTITNNKATQIAFEGWTPEHVGCRTSYDYIISQIEVLFPEIIEKIQLHNGHKDKASKEADSSKKDALSNIEKLTVLINDNLSVCRESLDPWNVRELEEKLKELEGLKGQLNTILVQKNSTASVIKPIKKPAPQQSWQDQAWHNLQKLKKQSTSSFERYVPIIISSPAVKAAGSAATEVGNTVIPVFNGIGDFLGTLKAITGNYSDSN
jgi:hypothetical protein